ncbi:hypothetical protein QFZ53_001743 [Microbacterium natoriense]|uniref:DUF5134 domain-containing protein n=1 Tax=Microbacterium natoriense TaxID=284570 RepID=A0AAW8EX29_9MICO|nr:hypothetical protein [Microbacterium natoriense]MDQ0647547.1 hypothetical protein [Microbacterium natoriense]
MDHALAAAHWLTAGAALASAAACVAAWRAVPWQGRQSALASAAAMLALAAGEVPAGIGLLLGAALLVSAMLGTAGVRGTTAAATCCHRAVGSLVMAVCVFQGASGGTASAPTAHAGHGLTGVLAVLGTVGVVGIVVWTVVTQWFMEPVHRGRAGRLLALESWAMAAGMAMMHAAA